MRFNLLKSRRGSGADAINLAGGEAFTMTPKLELASVLLTCTLQDQFYRTTNQSVARVRQLIVAAGDPLFVAKAAIHARTEGGMRSVTHLVAAELAKTVKGQKWTRQFFDRVVRRPDDVLEILACHIALHGRPIPNSMKKGLGAALARFDAYQLAKYRRGNADIALVDAVNLLHPPHTGALRQLVDGTLPAADTWETKLTRAGAAAESDDHLAELKKEAWVDLVRSRKIGYFALLRNLRNILLSAPEIASAAIGLLEDDALIRKSLVLPFRYLAALDALQQTNLPNAGEVLAALGRAVDKSLANVPAFAGRTLIALDGSGSMQGRPIKIGALFAAALAKSNDADVLLFSDGAKYVTVNRRDSTLTVAQWLESKIQAAGTNFHAIFETANRKYDRIIILSDMQGWIGHQAPTATFSAYRARHRADPKVFSFDLQGYGTLQFPQRNVFCVAGFSDRALETLRRLDEDPSALLRQIEAIEL